jgi:hypothetical protein
VQGRSFFCGNQRRIGAGQSFRADVVLPHPTQSRAAQRGCVQPDQWLEAGVTGFRESPVMRLIELSVPLLPEPQIEKLLAKSTHEVKELYITDQGDAIRRNQAAELRDAAWQRAAQENSVFNEQIEALRKALRVAEEGKRAYTPAMKHQMMVAFLMINDPGARRLLADVLFSRMSRAPGHMNYAMSIAQEATKMGTEIGLKNGWESEHAKTITLEQSLRNVLRGRLRVVYQPDQRK